MKYIIYLLLLVSAVHQNSWASRHDDECEAMRITSEKLKLFEDQMEWYFSYREAFVKENEESFKKSGELQEAIERNAIIMAKFKELHREFIHFRDQVTDFILHDWGCDGDQEVPGYPRALCLHAEGTLTDWYTKVLPECIFPKGWESMYKSKLTTVTDD